MPISLLASLMLSLATADAASGQFVASCAVELVPQCPANQTCNLNQRDEYGFTCAMRAAQRGNETVIDFLGSKKEVEWNLVDTAGLTALTHLRTRLQHEDSYGYSELARMRSIYGKMKSFGAVEYDYVDQVVNGSTNRPKPVVDRVKEIREQFASLQKQLGKAKAYKHRSLKVDGKMSSCPYSYSERKFLAKYDKDQNLIFFRIQKDYRDETCNTLIVDKYTQDCYWHEGELVFTLLAGGDVPAGAGSNTPSQDRIYLDRDSVVLAAEKIMLGNFFGIYVPTEITSREQFDLMKNAPSSGSRDDLRSIASRCMEEYQAVRDSLR